jgi:hypothetical protein
VQVRVEHGERAAAQQPLGQANAEDLVGATVGLPRPQTVDSLREAHSDEVTHRAERGHRHPDDKEGERDAVRPEGARAHHSAAVPAAAARPTSRGVRMASAGGDAIDDDGGAR